MAATVRSEDPSARTATNDMGKRTYTRAWTVVTSSRTDDAYTVGSATGLPVIGNTHPSDANAFCQQLAVTQKSGWRVWTVTATYSTERPLNTNPTSDPAIINWNSEQFQKPAVFDRNGNLIVNSAGDPFDPPLMMDDSRRVVTVQKNLAVVPVWILDYQDAVNSDTFSIDGVSIGVGLAKMQAVTVGPVERRSSTVFRTVNFTIHLQRDGWALEPLDAGFRELAEESASVNAGPCGASAVRNILNCYDQQPVAAPVPLDGEGRALSEPSPTNCVFLTYHVYKTRAFSSLPLT